MQQGHLLCECWRAEPFPNVQSQQGQVAPTTLRLCKQVPPWGDLALLQETVAALVSTGCSCLQFTLQKLVELWKWGLSPPTPCPMPQAPKGKAGGHLSSVSTCAPHTGIGSVEQAGSTIGDLCARCSHPGTVTGVTQLGTDTVTSLVISDREDEGH